MSLDRRTVLKGMAIGGIAAPMLGAALPALANGMTGAASATDVPVLAVVGTSSGAAFAQGAHAGLGSLLQVRQAGSDLVRLLRELEKMWHGDRPMRIVGLLDDASSAPLLDVARSAGTRIAWLGQHSVQAGGSRHRLLTTDRVEGGARELARQLRDCGAGFSLTEDRQHSLTPVFQAEALACGSADPGQWAAAVGWLLARTDAQAPAPAPLPHSGRAPHPGSFVSFLIEPEGV